VESRIVIQTDETEAGDLLGFIYDVQSPQQVATRQVGRVEGDTLSIETTGRGGGQGAQPWQP
jgi:hypothetical protein